MTGTLHTHFITDLQTSPVRYDCPISQTRKLSPPKGYKGPCSRSPSWNAALGECGSEVMLVSTIFGHVLSAQGSSSGGRSHQMGQHKLLTPARGMPWPQLLMLVPLARRSGNSMCHMTHAQTCITQPTRGFSAKSNLEAEGWLLGSREAEQPNGGSHATETRKD